MSQVINKKKALTDNKVIEIDYQFMIETKRSGAIWKGNWLIRSVFPDYYTTVFQKNDLWKRIAIRLTSKTSLRIFELRFFDS